MSEFDDNGLPLDQSFQQAMQRMVQDDNLVATWTSLQDGVATIQNASTVPGNKCEICKTEYTNSQVLMRHEACQNTFHAFCFLSWLKDNCTCPWCRACMKKICLDHMNIFANGAWQRYFDGLPEHDEFFERIAISGHVNNGLEAADWLYLQVEGDQEYLTQQNLSLEDAIVELFDNLGSPEGPQIIRDLNAEVRNTRAQWVQDWNNFSSKFNDNENPPVMQLASPEPLHIFRNSVEVAYFNLDTREDYADSWFEQQLTWVQTSKRSTEAEEPLEQWLRLRKSALGDWNMVITDAYNHLRSRSAIWAALEADNNLPPQPVITSFADLQAVNHASARGSS